MAMGNLMKYMDIPSSVSVKNAIAASISCPKCGYKFVQNDIREQSFQDFLKTAIYSTPVFSKGLMNIEMGISIHGKIEESVGKSVISLEDAEYVKMRDCIDQVDWVPSIVYQFAPFFKAFKNASDKEL